MVLIRTADVRGTAARVHVHLWMADGDQLLVTPHPPPPAAAVMEEDFYLAGIKGGSVSFLMLSSSLCVSFS